MKMSSYVIAVWEPEANDSRCVVLYYNCYHVGEFPSESYWVVPGTWEE